MARVTDDDCVAVSRAVHRRDSHGQAACVGTDGWHSVPLIFTGYSNAGEYVFQRLLFVPVGAFEVTSFIMPSSRLSLDGPSADAASAADSKLWLSGYGDNVRIASTWKDVVQPAMGGSGASGLSGRFEPISLLRLCSSSKLGGVADDALRLSKPRIYGAPWFVGQRPEHGTCALLDAVCNAIIRSAVRRGSEPQSVSSALIGALTACVLIHHIDHRLVPVHDHALVRAVAGLVATVLRVHSSSNALKIIGLAIGYAGDKANEVLQTLSTVARQVCGVYVGSSKTSGSGYPSSAASGTFTTPVSTPKLEVFRDTEPLLPDALVVLVRWAFHTIPSQSASEQLSRLGLDFVDIAVDMHKRHPVTARVMQLLIQQLTIPHTAVRVHAALAVPDATSCQ